MHRTSSNYEDLLQCIKIKDFLNYIEDLINDGFIVKEDKKYYLYKYYEEELIISHRLRDISHFKLKRITKLDEKIAEFEKEQGIKYNDEQKKAIKEGLKNNISIISGGPGTGKTTIINAIVNIYIKSELLTKDEILSDIALLAPTGRASKRLALSTGLMGHTIHRHLKWHKEEDSFEYDSLKYKELADPITTTFESNGGITKTKIDGKYEFTLKIDNGAINTITCVGYFKKGQIIPNKIDISNPTDGFTLIPNDCNKTSFDISLNPTDTSSNKLILTEVYKLKDSD